MTEADWRLFTTLIRFDAVYVGHFKCNRQRIEDYPALSNLHPRALPDTRHRSDNASRSDQSATITIATQTSTRPR